MEKDGKTEKPTLKRLKDARKRGEVGKSPDVAIAFSLLGFAFLLKPLMLFLIQKFSPFFITSLDRIDSVEILYQDLPRVFFQAILMFFIMAMPFFILAMALGILANILQVGLLFSWKAIKPNMKRLNLFTNFKQLFSIQAIMNSLKMLGKLAIVILFCYRSFIETFPQLMTASTLGTRKLIFFLLDFAQSLFLKVALCLLVLSVVDLAYQKYQHQKKLRMSKQEIKEEYKQMEGDPKVKAQRKAQYQAMLRNAVANVQKATVVITNPTHYAVAIRYEASQDEVPMVLAKGADLLAKKIKEEAQVNHIPMIENKPVARALYAKVEPGEHIPLELYEALAEIIATVYQLEEAAKHKV